MHFIILIVVIGRAAVVTVVIVLLPLLLLHLHSNVSVLPPLIVSVIVSESTTFSISLQLFYVCYFIVLVVGAGNGNEIG